MARPLLSGRADQRFAAALSAYPGPELTLEQSQTVISQAIRAGGPYLLARPGGNELDVVRHYLSVRISRDTPDGRPSYPERMVRDVGDGAGVVPGIDGALDRFSARYLSALVAADLLATAPWTRWSALLPGMERIPNAHLNVLDAFAAVKAGLVPWTRGLAGRRVLVVNPFIRSIRRQFERREAVTGLSDVLPEFELTLLKPPVTHGGNPDAITWEEGLDRTIAAMSRIDFDVAIVGAGGYGLPLAAHAKSLGRVGINLGGRTQVIFGVAGKRWRASDTYDGIIDATWIAPDGAERPPRTDLVEDGAYW